MATKKGKKGKGRGKGKTPYAANGTGRPRTGVGATIREMLEDDPELTNAEVAEKALKKHPDSSTNAGCVAWYRNQLKSGGKPAKAKAKAKTKAKTKKARKPKEAPVEESAAA